MKALFLVLDTVRQDYLGCYGSPWVKTPNIDRLANCGLQFDNHWVGSLPCMPARREFTTGRYNFIYRGWGPIEPYDDVLPRLLQDRGIFTHLLTDHYHYFELGGENYHTAFNTWELFRGQEYDPWVSLVDRPALPDRLDPRITPRDDQNYKNRLRQVREEDFSGPRTAASAVQWLEDNRHADNWFMQVEIFDPHEPFYCTPKYLEMYHDTWDGPLFDWPKYDVVKESPAAVEHIRKCYAGLLTMTDFWLGKILAKLDQLGIFDKTLIIFTTDHGTMLAEHGFWMKVFMPVYREIGQIPLIIKPPGGTTRPQRISTMTQTIDIMPTFLDYFGVPSPPFVHGRSLRPAMDGKRVREDGILGYFGMATNITDGRYFYMRNPVNADGGPLHAYTAMPVAGMNKWFPRSIHERIEMGRYFGHTYNLPLYKIPTLGRVPQAPTEDGGYATPHQLWDLLRDPAQQTPLVDLTIENHFIERLRAHLKICEAPDEQYTRLGLNP